jgi:hypothetical protein
MDGGLGGSEAPRRSLRPAGLAVLTLCTFVIDIPVACRPWPHMVGSTYSRALWLRELKRLAARNAATFQSWAGGAVHGALISF